MPERYMIVFEGKTREGHDPEEVKNRLAQLLRMQPAAVSPLFAGVHHILWRNLDLQTATAIKAAVEKTGADCRIRRARTNGEESAVKAAVGSPSQAKPATSPSAGNRVPAETRQPLALDDQATGSEHKCPKCGYEGQGIGDDLIERGQCPACGLVLVKYHPSEEEVSSRDADETPDRVADAPKQSAIDERSWEESAEAWDEPEDAADWPVFSRGTAILSLIVGAGLTVLPPGYYIQSRPLRGLLAGLAVVFVSCLAYQSYIFYVRKRENVLPYVLVSLGILAVLAAVGGLLYRIYSGIATLYSGPGWRSHLTFPRVGLLLSAIYLGAAVFLAYADQNQPVQKTGGSQGEQVRIVKENATADSARYSGAVRKARETHGQRFPEAERPTQYLYFKNVYVTTATSSGLSFPAMIESLVPSFELADFHPVLDPDVELLMFNTIAFRDELAVEGIISDDLQKTLENLAWTWAEPTGVESRTLSFAERVALFDAQCPIDDVSYLARSQ